MHIIEDNAVAYLDGCIKEAEMLEYYGDSAKLRVIRDGITELHEIDGEDDELDCEPPACTYGEVVRYVASALMRVKDIYQENILNAMLSGMSFTIASIWDLEQNEAADDINGYAAEYREQSCTNEG